MVSHNVLSDCWSFRSMCIKDTLHKPDAFFIGCNMGIGTFKYTKAILNFFILESIQKAKANSL